MSKKLLDGWAEAEKFADTNRDNRITIEEWLVFCDALTMDNNLYCITVTNVAAVIFDACNFDENGILEKDEWSLLFRIYGKTIENADESFAIITENERRLLNRDCVLNLLDDFFYSEDENKIGNYIFGKLV